MYHRYIIDITHAYTAIVAPEHQLCRVYSYILQNTSYIFHKMIKVNHMLVQAQMHGLTRQYQMLLLF